MSDLIDRQAAIDEIRRFAGYLDEDMINRIHIALNRLPSAQQKPLKYTGESICLYCQTENCDGCMYEPMMEEQE